MKEIILETADGFPLRVRQTDVANRPLLLVVTPLATKPTFIARALGALSSRFDVITWEPRLMVEPQVAMPSPAALSIEAHLNDVEVILDHFEAERVHLVGYCSGAALALHVAAHNRRVDRLALINGAYFLQPKACELTQYERDMLALAPQIASDEEAAGQLFTQFLREGSALKRRAHEFGDEIYRPYSDVTSFYRFGVGLAHLIRSDARRVARVIRKPTLVYSSKQDDRTHVASSLLMASLISGSEGHYEETGDHYEFCRARTQLIDRLVRFFADSGESM